MKSKWIWVLAFGVLSAAVYGGIALATPPTPAPGVTTTTFGVGRFDSIDSKTKTDIDPGRRDDFWKAAHQDEGRVGLYVLQNTIQPGSDVRLAQPSRAQPGDRQVRHGDVLHGRRSDLRSAGRRPDRASSTTATTCTSWERGQRRPRDGRRLPGPGGVRTADRRAGARPTAPPFRTVDLTRGGRVRPPSTRPSRSTGNTASPCSELRCVVDAVMAQPQPPPGSEPPTPQRNRFRFRRRRRISIR